MTVQGCSSRPRALTGGEGTSPTSLALPRVAPPPWGLSHTGDGDRGARPEAGAPKPTLSCCWPQAEAFRTPQR